MSAVKPNQKHLAALDPCPQCGGYRYLVVRERMKSLDILVRCISKDGQDLQTYKTVAKIPRSTLNAHDKGNSRFRDTGTLQNLTLQLRTNLKAISEVVTKIEDSAD